MMVAGCQDAPRQVGVPQCSWRGLDVTHVHECDEAVQARDLREAMRAVADGTRNPSPPITHAVPLRETGRAFPLMRGRPNGFAKAVVAP